METLQLKTKEDIESLKKNWLSDPCWDIEDTEGSEAHREELEKFHEEKKLEWTKARLEREWAEMERLGINNKSTYLYLKNLEYSIETLEKRVYAIETKI